VERSVGPQVNDQNGVQQEELYSVGHRWKLGPGFGETCLKKLRLYPCILDLFQLSVLCFFEEIATKQQATSHLIS